MTTIHRFQFQRQVPLDAAEATLILALIAAEALHGQPSVRLSVSYLFSREKLVCVIDGDNDIAHQVLLVFIQFLTHEFGESAFQVRRECHGAPTAANASVGGTGKAVAS